MSNDFYQLDLISSIENIVSAENQYDFRTRNHTLKWLHAFQNNTSLTGKLVKSNYLPQNLFPEINSDNVIRFKSQIKYNSGQFEFKDKREEKYDYYIGIQVPSKSCFLSLKNARKINSFLKYRRINIEAISNIRIPFPM